MDALPFWCSPIVSPSSSSHVPDVSGSIDSGIVASVGGGEPCGSLLESLSVSFGFLSGVGLNTDTSCSSNCSSGDTESGLSSLMRWGEGESNRGFSARPPDRIPDKNDATGFFGFGGVIAGALDGWTAEVTNAGVETAGGEGGETEEFMRTLTRLRGTTRPEEERKVLARGEAGRAEDGFWGWFMLWSWTPDAFESCTFSLSCWDDAATRSEERLE
mmetsp:Transcript_9222/g.20357  ORF Transcript_9222/g.20357 Transcript_9222/m.20357 type:complete len:216 (-) Transcript_9222:188-835(-)